jgi:hypothetical protein
MREAIREQPEKSESASGKHSPGMSQLKLARKEAGATGQLPVFCYRFILYFQDGFPLVNPFFISATEDFRR